MATRYKASLLGTAKQEMLEMKERRVSK